MRRVRRSSRRESASEQPDASRGLVPGNPGVVPMSHLRAKFQQTSGQQLNTSHHFPAAVSEYSPSPVKLGRAGDHPMSRKCFNPVCAPAVPCRALPMPCRTPPPLLPRSALARGAQKQIMNEAPVANNLVSFAGALLWAPHALPLHLPSKAEHLGQGTFLLTDIHLPRSVPSLACGSQVSPSRGNGGGKGSHRLGIRPREGQAERLGPVCLALGGGKGAGIFPREAITNFFTEPAPRAPTGCGQGGTCFPNTAETFGRQCSLIWHTRGPLPRADLSRLMTRLQFLVDIDTASLDKGCVEDRSLSTRAAGAVLRPSRAVSPTT